MNGGEDLAKEIAGYCDVGELEGNCARMAHDARADLDQPRLQARQGPRGDLFRQFGRLQEHAEIVGEGMELQANLVLRHRPA